MNGINPTIRLHIWLENEQGEIIFGSGRAALIANIARYGSLKKAAQSMGISYRAAWGKIKQTEAIIGEKMLEKSGSKREGYRLTEFGELISSMYSEWFSGVEKFALAESERIFPWPCKMFIDDNGPDDSSESSL